MCLPTPLDLDEAVTFMVTLSPAEKVMPVKSYATSGYHSNQGSEYSQYENHGHETVTGPQADTVTDCLGHIFYGRRSIENAYAALNIP